MESKIQKIILLLNYLPDENTWFNKVFSKYGKVSIYGISDLPKKLRYNRFLSLINFIAKFILACKGISKTKKNDILIIWDNTFTGVISGILAYIFNKKFTIILINMIDHGGSKIFLSIKKKLYKIAFKKIIATVNSAELKNKYAEQLNIPLERIYELADTFAGFGDYLSNENKLKVKNEYDVFCGGSSHRDWKLFIETAKLFPDKKFVGIAREKHFDKKIIIPENTEILFDADFSIFIEKLKKSRVCLIPLLTQSQAGQMVIFQAGLLKKPVVTTKTVAIQKYIRNNKNGILTRFKNIDVFKTG